jgi:hypothetical protein
MMANFAPCQTDQSQDKNGLLVFAGRRIMHNYPYSYTTTTPFINSDSPKYVERSDTGRYKFGSQEDGTQAAHKFGFGLLNVIETHSSGAPLSDSAKKELIREMNSDENLRIKTGYGNQTLDERRDARIAQSYLYGTPIQEKTTANRAYQAYLGASTLSNQKYAQELGELRVRNPETGGYYKLKNHAKYH